ncbi:MAG TPA: hypothetical protein VF701_04550 [Thermoanaerobaculia bacterium]
MQQGHDSGNRRRAGLLYIVVSLLAVPSVVWVLVDTSAWGGDQAQYGKASVDLYMTLIRQPSAWPLQLLDVFPSKPNGLIWLGQLFLPLASIAGGVDQALLLMVVVLHAITLLLVARAVRELSPQSVLPPLAAVLSIACAPLFIYYSHQYLVELLQTASVAWFVLILCCSPRWSRRFIIAQLFAASALALSTKQIQPLFLVWPVLWVLWYMWSVRTQLRAGIVVHRAVLLGTLLGGAVLWALTLAWYLRNLRAVLQHLYAGSYGPGVRLFWGKEDTYVNTLTYWARTFISSFGPPSVVVVGTVIILSALFVVRRRDAGWVTHSTVTAVIAILQIATVLAVFSLSPTRQARYLIPVLPYFALLLGVALAQLKRPLIAAATIAVCGGQFLSLHAQSFGLRPWTSPHVRVAERHAKSGRIIRAVVERTCRGTTSSVRNVLAVDARFAGVNGDWLGPSTANYEVAKTDLTGDLALPCEFNYVGGDFFGAPVDIAWSRVVTSDVEHFITVDPAIYRPPVLAFNEALNAETFPILIGKLRQSGSFVQERGLDIDPGIVIFRRASGATTALFAALLRTDLGDVTGLVDLRPEGILIHPGQSTKTTAVFDASQFQQLVVRAAIAPLDPEGASVPNAGTVVVALRVDGVPIFATPVNRHAEVERVVDLSNARELEITVDNDDGKSWWDWLVISARAVDSPREEAERPPGWEE